MNTGQKPKKTPEQKKNIAKTLAATLFFINCNDSCMLGANHCKFEKRCDIIKNSILTTRKKTNEKK